MQSDPYKHDPFARRPGLSRLAILGAALALLLALAMPLVLHMRIHEDSRGHWELLLYLIYLSSLPAFVLAGRRPFAGAVWLLAIGGVLGAWIVSQQFGPFDADLLLTRDFWPADLPIVGGLVFLLAAAIGKTPSRKRQAP